jgi:hypothetical protein
MIGRYTAGAPGPARGERASCQADSVKPRREARLGRARRTQRHWGPWHWQVRECNWYLTRMRVMVRPGWPWPGPHSGREYNCRQRRLIPARPWVYLIRVTLVTVESSFNELLSGPWPGQLAVWPAALCFKCGVVLHEVRSRKLTQIKTVCFGFLKYISHRSHVPHRDHAASSGDCKSF